MDFIFLFALFVLIVFISFVYAAICKGWCHSKADLTGKTAIVTGANTGIGYCTARDLARRNARVILACRSLERGRAAAANIREETGNENVHVKMLDLSSMKSVRAFAAEINKEEPQLNILINNAAVTGLDKTMTDEGLELTYAVNHFGPFLLTNLLVDLLKKSSPSRVVVVSSIVNIFGSVDCDNLCAEKDFSIAWAYYNSKLCNVLFTKELARRLRGTGVLANCLHPGSIRTNLLRNIPAIIRIPILMLGSLFFKTPEEGAQTSIYCAVDEAVEGVSGEYFIDCRSAEHGIWINKSAYDEGLCKKLWEVSEKITKLKSS